MTLSTSLILSGTLRMAKQLKPRGSIKHLDIGSGHGDLIQLLREAEFINKSSACDYTDSLMKLDDIKVTEVNLNEHGLPYQDGAFDLVTCTEVIEHLEHYRKTIREIYRVLEPAGVVVISTPNVLNLKSRIRFLIFGFFNLFGPLHIKESELHTTGGHINPVSLFYLTHSLLDAGFEKIALTIDKRQGTSKLWLLFLYVPIKIFSKLTARKEKSRYKTIDIHNEYFVRQINFLDVLLGRTIIVGGIKPA
ncbi:class I SAM-dependent methyltransferase [Polaromonas sp. JS666]|uniref:class I SAM-dependent methyltransferase n=1 Tax=Polaromonas sp. (strain JS666 / ATCC BAA-500) TaxID=296591 RepID=UPI00005349A7|nr:class I SAM-dependent methyltransferase [Polaromonas sp. JS666]ABE47295.1 Methylase involved in ubiquinone/menaquinone biosynthesis-like [Polaromonas sp. JS666]